MVQNSADMTAAVIGQISTGPFIFDRPVAKILGPTYNQ